jgi:hypothetical protein
VYVFSDNNTIQWAVSTFIKDQHLDNEDIQWLVDNYEKSEHIVNRLLRYPIQNKLISEWANFIYYNGKLNSRLSEIISVLIDIDIPEYVEDSTDQIMWAIYYSKCSNSIKKDLIIKHLNYEEYVSSLEVSKRLNISEISLKLLSHYKKFATK